jgi:hypothetical protein
MHDEKEQAADLWASVSPRNETTHEPAASVGEPAKTAGGFVDTWS